ncbi:MAG: hypothetical protein VKP57_12400 [Candidatus Sericytochromatia bacterium]|nr:hypothetical protein [Candidatus Sericytochromatia bacterium]
MNILDVLWEGLGRPAGEPGEKPWLASRSLTALALGLPSLHLAAILQLPAVAGMAWTIAAVWLGFLLLDAHASLVHRRLLAAGGQAPLEAVDDVLATGVWPWLLWPALSGLVPDPGPWIMALGLGAWQVTRTTNDLARVSGVGAERCLSAWIRPLGNALLGLVLLIVAGASLALGRLAP